jgi:hypothetical protein
VSHRSSPTTTRVFYCRLFSQRQFIVQEVRTSLGGDRANRKKRRSKTRTAARKADAHAHLSRPVVGRVCHLTCVTNNPSTPSLLWCRVQMPLSLCLYCPRVASGGINVELPRVISLVQVPSAASPNTLLERFKLIFAAPKREAPFKGRHTSSPQQRPSPQAAAKIALILHTSSPLNARTARY